MSEEHKQEDLTDDFADASDADDVPALETFPSDTVFRWEVRAKDVLLSRALLAQLFPQAIRSDEVVEEVGMEKKAVGSLLSVLGKLALRVLRVLVIVALGVFGLFALFWGLAELGGHAPAYSVEAYGLAIWLTLVAVVDAVTMPLLKAPLFRDRKAARIRLCGFLSLPFLMYATACPTTTSFVLKTTEAPPLFWDWALFYGYMLLDVVFVGFPQGVYGELTSFRPPSKLAGVITFWAKTVMLVGVVAMIFGTIRRALARTYSYDGTVSEFRSWAAFQFGRRWSRAKKRGFSYWFGRLTGKVRNRVYEVSVRAREHPFARQNEPIPLYEFEEFRYPEWKVDQRGQLTTRDLDKRRAKALQPAEPVPKLDDKEKREKALRYNKMLFVVLAAIAGMFAFLAVIFVAISIPAYFLFHKAFHWDLSLSIVAALLAGLTAVWLDRMIGERRRALQYVTLSRVKSHALRGTEEVPSADIVRVLNVDTKGLVTWVGILLVAPFAFIAFLFAAIVGRIRSWRAKAKWKRPRISLGGTFKKRDLPAGVDFYEQISNVEGVRMIVHEKLKTAWLFHHRHFRFQGRLHYAYLEKNAVIMLPDRGQGERVVIRKEQCEKLWKCERLYTLLVEDGKAPSRPEHVQELRCARTLSDILDKQGGPPC